MAEDPLAQLLDMVRAGYGKYADTFRNAGYIGATPIVYVVKVLALLVRCHAS